MTHSRVFRYAPGQRLSIADHFDGDGKSGIELRFHLHEDIDVVATNDGYSLSRGGRQVARIDLPPCRISNRAISRSEAKPLFGWRSPSYRRLVGVTTILVEMDRQTRNCLTNIHFG